MADKQFINGLRVYKPRDNAPSFIIANLSIKYEDFRVAIADMVNERGYINIDIKESKKGEYYAELNTYKADMTKPTSLSNDEVNTLQALRGEKNEEIVASDIPF